MSKDIFSQVYNKVKEFNEKFGSFVEMGKNEVNQNNKNKDDFFLKNIELFQKAKDVFDEIKEQTSNILEKQGSIPFLKDKDEQLKRTVDNSKKAKNLEEAFVETGGKVYSALERVTPEGFIKGLVKDLLEISKEIQKNLEKFNEKALSSMKDYVNDRLKVNGVNKISLEKIKENGLLGLSKEDINSMFAFQQFKEKILNSGIFSDKVVQMFKENRFDELKNMYSKMSPLGFLISTLAETSEKIEKVTNAVGEYIENQVKENPSLSVETIIQNQASGFDKESVSKFTSIASKLASIASVNPYVKIAVNILGVASESREKEVEKERTI